MDHGRLTTRSGLFRLSRNPATRQSLVFLDDFNLLQHSIGETTQSSVRRNDLNCSPLLLRLGQALQSFLNNAKFQHTTTPPQLQSYGPQADEKVAPIWREICPLTVPDCS